MKSNHTFQKNRKSRRRSRTSSHWSLRKPDRGQPTNNKNHNHNFRR